MNLLETYSNNCSVNVAAAVRPHINEKFFPIPVEKYITLQTKSGMPAKDYDWFQEVIDLILPHLEKQNIKIIWLGKEDPKNLSQPYMNVIDLRNQTNIGQAAYILKRSLCHLSVDSWGCHFAGANYIPLVALYGSTTIKNHSPHHINDKCVLLESHRNGNKASFAREENPKTVNLINPEDIAESVLKLLDIDFAPEYKTVEINDAYNHRTVESVPNQVINIGNLRISSLIVRMDYEFNERNLLGQLHHCPCTIVTDRPINLDLLQRVRGHVKEIVYNIKDSPEPKFEFTRDLFNLKIPYRLMTFLSDEEVNKYRLDFMDWGIIQVREKNKPKDFKIEEIDSYYYKTNKFLLSNGKIYQSFYDYKNDRPIPHLKSTPQQLINQNLDLLWFDKEYNYFLKKS